MSKDNVFFIGVDVGSSSVRAALVSKDGTVVNVATQPITTWTPKDGFYEQSSDDIWASCCHIIKEVSSGIAPAYVKGIGFDATCSLVVLDSAGRPISVSPTGDNDQNVIVWMDHRANEEADFINNSSHSVLRYVGGKMSLEMQIPKLLWLKKHLPDCWQKAHYFFDLPDFLTWKATGCDSRSLCSVVCKWTYEASPVQNKGWNEIFFNEIGLADLLLDNCRKIGSEVKEPGSPCGQGLTVESADSLGLLAATPVATSLIDAHAGGLALIGASGSQASQLGLICGTSTCHMALSERAVYVEGVWGPYYSAMVPGMWLNEGGQSATGKLIDHVVESHPAMPAILLKIGTKQHISEYLNVLLEKMALNSGLDSVDELTLDIHVYPDFHGNRSPLADPTLKGMVSGLSLSTSEEDLALIYLSTLQALAYGTGTIVAALEHSGYTQMGRLLLCGGLSSNRLFVSTQANALQRPVLVPHRHDSVVMVGAAMLAAVASRTYGSLAQAANAMAVPTNTVLPQACTALYHSKKSKVFMKMLEDQKIYKGMMRVNAS